MIYRCVLRTYVFFFFFIIFFCLSRDWLSDEIYILISYESLLIINNNRNNQVPRAGSSGRVFTDRIGVRPEPSGFYRDPTRHDLLFVGPNPWESTCPEFYVHNLVDRTPRLIAYSGICRLLGTNKGIRDLFMDRRRKRRMILIRVSYKYDGRKTVDLAIITRRHTYLKLW